MKAEQALVDKAVQHLVPHRHVGPISRKVAGKSGIASRNVPPLTARGSPIRSKFVLVCQPSPVKPFPPCSAGTDGSAPASASGNTGYAFLSTEASLGVDPDGEAPVAGGGVDPPPQAAVTTRTPSEPINQVCILARTSTSLLVAPIVHSLSSGRRGRKKRSHQQWRLFEQTSSEHAVCMLEDDGVHRTGREPGGKTF